MVLKFLILFFLPPEDDIKTLSTKIKKNEKQLANKSKIKKIESENI